MIKSVLAAVLMLFLADLAAAAADAPAAKANPGGSVQVAAVKAPAPRRGHRHKTSAHRRYPRGDLRYCLKLKSDEAIIICAERSR
jgi:hypothetical protein